MRKYTYKRGKNGNVRDGRRRSGRSRRGGEALASGGFGCIFKPALRCKGSDTRINGVSKMSIEEHGKQEMSEITIIKDRLKKIKDYQKHYLLDVDMCKPEKLTDDDMKHFDKKCYALTRYNINEKNVNSRIGRLTILNMPDAGTDLKDWLVSDDKITKERMFILNEVVSAMITKGVRPMNEAGVIHHDLKDRNIMIDKQLNARIIDWGLAGVVKDNTNTNTNTKTKTNTIPSEIMNRPLQFNTPFSSMMLSDEFKMNYATFLQRVKDDDVLFNRVNIRNYVVNEYLIKLARYYGYYDDNVVLFKMIFSPGISDETFLPDVKKDNLIEYGYYLYYLSNYITDILMKFTNDKLEFDVNKYFSEVYLFNSDIFGLMTVYYNFFEINLEKIDLPLETKKKYLNRIRTMLVENIYTNGGEKIDIIKLTKDIKALNNILENGTQMRPVRDLKRNYSITNDINHSPRSVMSLLSNSRASKSKSKSKSKSSSKPRTSLRKSTKLSIT
jgi:serine/threonine protein kinase